jgi:hypothetical protein
MTGPWVVAAVFWAVRPPHDVDPARRAWHPRMARALWAAILTAAVIIERYGLARPGSGWTLSETIRRSWRTDTTAGAWAFRAAWAALAWWLPGHIVAWRRAAQASS